MKKKIRNFTIISHIDHGKSTLADRFLELTKTIPNSKMKEQFLDQMELEREKGITIRMHPVQLSYDQEGEKYLLNLIDTPGHIDFSYEVSRALAAVEGAVLLVDASQGVQAQTINHLRLAQKQELTILPVINKIDLPIAEKEKAKEELANLLKIDKEAILEISAKKGWGVEELLREIIRRFSPPAQDEEKPFRGLIFDSCYDNFRGTIVYLRVKEGSIKAGQTVRFLASGLEGEVKEVGVFSPDLVKSQELTAGEIGYLVSGLKEVGRVKIGDTVALKKEASSLELLPGYQDPQPVVFNDLYPQEETTFEALKSGLEKLKLNDPALIFYSIFREGLGKGFQIGFLGLLHAEVVVRRLKEEFSLDLVITAPTVSYHLETTQGPKIINSPVDWPSSVSIKKVTEPWAKLGIIVPTDYLGKTMKLLGSLSGEFSQSQPLGEGRYLFSYYAPLREVVSGFDDHLKSLTQGRASWRYEIESYRPGDLVKLEVAVGGELVEPLARITSRARAYSEGQVIADRLKELLPAQQFSVPIQIYQEGKVIVRRTIKARRKDVTAPLYGGDYTRKKKLLVRQRKGKKELASRAKIKIPSSVFLSLLKEKE
jgi:GTP-binding protein LepA